MEDINTVLMENPDETHQAHLNMMEEVVYELRKCVIKTAIQNTKLREEIGLMLLSDKTLASKAGVSISQLSLLYTKAIENQNTPISYNLKALQDVLDSRGVSKIPTCLFLEKETVGEELKLVSSLYHKLKSSDKPIAQNCCCKVSEEGSKEDTVENVENITLQSYPKVRIYDVPPRKKESTSFPQKTKISSYEGILRDIENVLKDQNSIPVDKKYDNGCNCNKAPISSISTPFYKELSLEKENDLNKQNEQIEKRIKDEQTHVYHFKKQGDINASFEHGAPGTLKIEDAERFNGMVNSIQLLSELKEQYKQLEKNYQTKIQQISKLTRENNMLKVNIQKAENEIEITGMESILTKKEISEYKRKAKLLMDSLEKNKQMETEIKQANKQQEHMYSELAKTKQIIEEQQIKMDVCKEKYLQSETEAEVQKHTIKKLQMENKMLDKNVELQIENVKNKYNEELKQLRPMPSLLKKAETSLQEVLSEKIFIERKYIQAISLLQEAGNQIQFMSTKLNKNTNPSTSTTLVDSQVRLCEEVMHENETLREGLATSQQQLSLKNQELLSVKQHVVELKENMMTLREECARQVVDMRLQCSRANHTAESKSLENDAAVIKIKTAARIALDENNEMKSMMQKEIESLKNNLSTAQRRLLELKGRIIDSNNSHDEGEEIQTICHIETCPNL